MNKKVAIVIPTFNRAGMVTRAIDTALAQTYPCQVIVCDHGSSDNTPEVIKEYGDKVIYIRKEKDFGISFCWLDGILHTEADYVHLHLDDDWMEPTYIEECVKYLEDEKVGMVFSDANLYDMVHDKCYPNCLNVQSVFGTGIFDVEKLEKEVLEHAFMLSPAACLYRRQDIIDAVYPGNLPIDFGGVYKGVGPDHFMTLLCLLRYTKVASVGKSLVTFSAHDGSITIDAHGNNDKAVKMAAAYNAVRKYYKLLKYYLENQEAVDDFGNAKQKRKTLRVKIMGIPFWKVSEKGDKTRYSLFGIPLGKAKITSKKSNYYFLGLPICSVKRGNND